MSWISSLVPYNASPRGRAAKNHKDQLSRARRRRLRANLENLEERTLLSGIGITYTPSTELLAISGDTHGDTFTMVEHSQTAGGTVTVTSPATTLINGSWTPLGFTTTGPVLNITVALPGGSNAANNITLTGAGKTVATTVNSVTINSPSPSATVVAPLNLTVGSLTSTSAGVDNHGNLTVTELSSGATMSGTLHATVGDSTFSGSVSISQTGCCPAFVELAGDTISGSVLVSEGVANGDIIELENSTGTGAAPDIITGSTTLTQGAGPAVSGCVGLNDLVCVTSTLSAANQVKDLTITQLGTGGNQFVNVENLKVSLLSFGVKVTQAGAPGVGGSGTAGAAAVVCNVTYTPQTVQLPVNVANLPSIVVTQTGGSNYADVANIILPGNITITQNNGGGNFAEVLDVVIGLTNLQSLQGFTIPYIGDVANTGNVTISQKGNGANVAVVDGNGGPFYGLNFVNNITITQGNANNTGNCFGLIVGDIAQINDTVAISNITITQGTSDTADSGSNIVAIGYAISGVSDPQPYLGLPNYHLNPVCPGCVGNFFSTSVEAGGATSITQFGANNLVNFGDSDPDDDGDGGDPDEDDYPSSFTTGTLDVNTGGGGGAIVQAFDTTVEAGSVGMYVITGGGSGNIFLDYGGNSGFTFYNYGYAYAGGTEIINPLDLV